MSSTSLASEKVSSDGGVDELRDVIYSLLSRCGVPLPTVEYDHDFDALCRADATRRGYPLEGPNSLDRFIPMGVAMSTTAYAHLKNKSTQVFIALYTTSLIYIDEAFQHNLDIVREFNEKFMHFKAQGDPVLDCFAALLLEVPKHFPKVGSNLVTTSTMNLITAMSLEYETKGNAIPDVALPYARLSRVISGSTEAYAIFVFPLGVELPTFIQAIPEMMTYLKYAKDILSSHTEETGGDTENYISLLGNLKQRRSTKKETLWHAADTVVDAHTRALEILKPYTTALDAYKSFVAGYIGFHAGMPRYKLGESGVEWSP